MTNSTSPTRRRRPLDAETVWAAAEGRWLGIFKALAPEELGLAIDHLGRHVPCPVHGGTDGFRLFDDAAKTGGGVCNSCGVKPRGWVLLQWLKGWGYADVIAQVGSVLGMCDAGPAPAPTIPLVAPPTKFTPEKVRQVRNDLNKVWREAVPLSHPRAAPAVEYLRLRGIQPDRSLLENSYLRYHPRLPLFRERENGAGTAYSGSWGAVLNMVVDVTGRPVTLNRTWLGPDARRLMLNGVKVKRRMMAYDQTTVDASGSATRLDPPGPILSVGEALEEAMAIRQAVRTPSWGATGWATLRAMQFPPEVRVVHIFANRDPSGIGQESGSALAVRCQEEGREAYVHIPPIEAGEKADWNDVLKKFGAAAFPIIREMSWLPNREPVNLAAYAL